MFALGAIATNTARQFADNGLVEMELNVGRSKLTISFLLWLKFVYFHTELTHIKHRST